MPHIERRSKLLAVVGLLVTLLAVGSLSLAETPKDKDANSQQPAAEKTSADANSKAPAKPKNLKIAHVRMVGIMQDSPPGYSLFRDPARETTIRDWLQRLAKIRNDDSVAAVAIEMGGLAVGWAHAQELSDAIIRLRKVKPVYVHMNSVGASQYLVASAGEHVSMHEAGTLYITGLTAELLFFRGTLDWLGIEPQMIQIGRFKGAAEPMMRNEPSAEMLETYNWLLDDLYDQMCSDIAGNRRFDGADPSERVRQAIDAGPLSADSAMEMGLVDEQLSRADWKDFVRKSVERNAPADSHVSWRKNYARTKHATMDFSNPFALFGTLLGGGKQEKITDPTIAIIHADGMIVSGRSRQGAFGQRMVGARTMVRTFDTVREDDRIKAVVFRINSPGGSALASEMIYQAVSKCAEVKPVIVSIAQVGGSGGYYIAVGGQTIYADASAVVGSIGVISGKLAISGMLEKIGVGRYELTRGRNAGLWTSRPWNDREQAIMRKHAQRTYDMFIDRVARGRAGRIEDVSAVAEGRVFTARQAVGNGLVDHVGGMRHATAAAKKAAGLKKCHYISLPRPQTLAGMLSGDDPDAAMPNRISFELELPALHARIAESAGLRYLVNLAECLDSEMVLTAMPYSLTVKP